jgi:hypothetical protein
VTDYEDRMKDYVPVNERIDAFYTAYPDGSIQSEIVELTDSRVTVKAYAFRTVDDPKPGTGHSSVNIPGSTPYTKGSEIENAETSAWGRAIAALGFEVKRGIASTEEVRNKQGRGTARASHPRDTGTSLPGPSLDQIKARLLEVAAEHHIGITALDMLIADRIPKDASAEEVRTGLIELGTNIGRGKHDGGVPPEQMPADEAIAAGAALVGKS